MPQILRIAEAVLYVSDLERAKQFYQNVLELPLTAQFADACFLQTGQRSTLILFDREALKTRQSVIPAHGADGRGHVAIAVPPDELDAWRRQLTNRGVEIEHEQTWPLGTRSIYFRDPDQNSIELIDGTHYEKVLQRYEADKG